MPKIAKKTWKLNVPFLICLGTVATVGAVGAYFWHAYQLRRNAAAYLERADAHVTQSDLKSAARSLHHYLTLVPEDIDARARLADVLDRSAKTRGEKQRAVELYFQVLAAAPHRCDLRRRQARLLLEIGRFDDALEQANQVLDVPKENNDAQTLVVRGVALHELARNEANDVTFAEVVAALQKAIKHNVGTAEHVELASRLANLYRDQRQPLYREATGDPDEQNGSKVLMQVDRDRLADKVIDDMVAANADRALAFLVRYHYRKTYSLPGADEDLDHALKLEPEKSRAILLAAGNRALQAGQPDEAAKHFQQMIDSFPGDRRGYLGLAQSCMAQANQDRNGRGLEQATDVLRQGLATVDKHDFELNAFLARLLIFVKRLDEAEKVLSVLSKVRDEQVLYSTAPTRNRMRVVVDLLRAEQSVAKGDYVKVPDLLQKVLLTKRAATEAPDDTAFRDETECRAYSLLGTTFGTLGEWDRAAEAFEKAVSLAPHRLRLRFAAARAWETAGSLDRAINHYQRCTTMPEADEPARLNFVRALLRKQLTLPPKNRNWQPVHDALGEIQTVAGDSFGTKLLGAELAAAQGQTSQALKLLQEAEAARPSSPSDWRMLVLMYQRLGEPQRADDATQRFAKLTKNSIESLLIRAELLVQRRQFRRAEQELDSVLSTLPADQQAAVRFLLAELSLRQREHDAARRHLENVVQSLPSSIRAVRLLCSLAVETNRLSDLERWEQRLRELEGPTGTEWRIYRAQRLMLQAKDSEDLRLIDAEQLQAEVEGMRPAWPVAFRLKGMIAERQGKTRDAVRAYERAMRLDQSRVSRDWDAARIVQLIYTAGRDTSTQPAFDRLPEILASSRTGSALAIARSVARGDVPRAVRDAREAVRARPNDPVAQIWLGYTLWLAENLEESETAFLRARELAPKSPQAWYELLAFYVAVKKLDEARATLVELDETAGIPEPQRSLLLAQGHQMVGDRAAVQSHFARLLQTHPDNVLVLRRAGRFFAVTDTDQAEQLLRKAIKLKPQDRNTHRALASLLASRGADSSFDEAGKLLSDGAGSEASEPADRRLHAQLLWRRGGTANRRKAAAWLEKLTANPASASSGDRLTLAEIYEVEGKLPAAAEQLGILTNRPIPRPEHLAAQADFLIRHLEVANKQFAEQADAAIKRLEQVEPTAIRTLGLRARWLKGLARDAEIESLVESFLKANSEQAEDAASQAKLLTSVAQVYSTVGQNDAAEKLFRRAAGIDPRARLSLALFLAGRASEEATTEAVGLCADAARSDSTSQAAVALGTVLTIGKSSAENVRTAEPILAQPLKEHDQDPDLLLAVGSFWQMTGRSDQAATLFRRVLELSPSSVAAMNNLAYHLVEVGKHSEAMDYINRAISIAGRQSWLMDTRGMVYLSRQQPNEAIELFQELVEQRAADPRFVFHLALAYRLAGKVPEAREALDRARADGLQLHTLTPWDQEQLAELDAFLAGVPTSPNPL